MKRVFAILMIMVLAMTPIASANRISLGVQPSEHFVHLSDANPKVYVSLNLFNPNGDIDAIYTLDPDDDIDEFIKCEEGFWCGEDIKVPMGTNRLTDYVQTKILFKKTVGEKDLETGIMIYGRPDLPDANDSMVSVRPSIKVNIFLTQEDYGGEVENSAPVPSSIYPVSPIGSSQVGSAGWSTTTTTTTTSTTTTTTTTIKPENVILIDELSGSEYSDSVSDNKIKSESNFAYIIAGIGFISLVGVGYYYVFMKDAPKKTKEKEIIAILLALVLIPSLVRADDLTIGVSVNSTYYCGNAVCDTAQGENQFNCVEDCGGDIYRTLNEIGEGSGNMLTLMSSPITALLIILSLVAGASISLKSIFLRYGED